MCQADFSNIHLLPEENRALFRYSRLSRVPEDDPHLPTFKHLGFVCLEGAVRDETGVMRGGWYVISDNGRRYLEYLKDKRRSERRDGRRFLITTIIAWLALVVAILSLIVQVLQAKGTIDLSQFLHR